MGFVTALQSVFWDPIKLIEEGFIQGMNKDMMLSLFRNRLNEGMKAISIDGSAFDSTQLACLQEAVDDGFWKVVLPYVK